MNISRKKLIAQLIAAAIVLIGIEVFFYSAYAKIPIKINNEKFLIKEKTVGDVLKTAGIKPKTGKLLSFDGEIVLDDLGEEPRIYLDGYRAKESTLVSRGARIDTVRGRNLREAIKERIQEIRPRTIIKGSGQFIVTESPGLSGERREYYLERSGLIVKSEIIKRAKPKILKRSDEDPKMMVALTFDDGPTPPFTRQVADILKRYEVPATFFVVGTQVLKYPDTVKYLKDQGFNVENHSLTHSRLDDKEQAVLDNEIQQSHDLITLNTGESPRWFRPPYGRLNGMLGETVTRKGYSIALWSVDPMDWRAESPEAIIQMMMSQVKPGAIVLLHDGGGDRQMTVAALPGIIERLKSAGYFFVTLDQLYKYRQ